MRSRLGKISSKAVISKKAQLGKKVTICEWVIVYDNVVIGDDTFIGPGAIIGEPLVGYYKDDNYENPETIIGPDSLIRSGSIIYAGNKIGARFTTGHNVVIREDSQFGDNCSFGTCSQADGHISVGYSCRFHNSVFIASYTEIKNNVHFYPYSTTLDSLHPPCKECRKGPTIENGAVICAYAILMPKIKVGKNSVVAAGALVRKDVPDGVLTYGNNERNPELISDIKCKLTDKKKPYPWVK